MGGCSRFRPFSHKCTETDSLNKLPRYRKSRFERFTWLKRWKVPSFYNWYYDEWNTLFRRSPPSSGEDTSRRHMIIFLFLLLSNGDSMLASTFYITFYTILSMNIIMFQFHSSFPLKVRFTTHHFLTKGFLPIPLWRLSSNYGLPCKHWTFLSSLSCIPYVLMVSWQLLRFLIGKIILVRYFSSLRMKPSNCLY